MGRLVRGALVVGMGLGVAGAGPLQPQGVTGPCHVKEFFVVNFGTSNTDMTVDGAGACEFTLFNPDNNVFQSAALITSAPAHGVAEAGLISSGRMAAIRYTPQPGFAGTDKFTATIEPSDKAVIVSVTVRGAR